jgi:hypothetical protein
MTVTVQSALSEVQAAVRRLRDLTRELVLTAVEDQPRNCQVHLLAVVHDAALAATDQAEQAAALLSSQQHQGVPPRQARRAVVDGQRCLTELGAALVRDLATPEMQNDLAALSRERGGEVTAWVRETGRCVQACQVALWTDLLPAILAYWEELAELHLELPERPAELHGRTSVNE